MADTVKYRAFLARSGADADIADRVYRALEGLRIAPDLGGRVTATGAVSPTLGPIYRDHHATTAETDDKLDPATVAALDEAAALIVLGSPDAARSKFVNEEVWFFRWIHPERPVIPLIVDGTPGDPDRECFPPALGAPPGDGRLADLRQGADGFDRAVAKVTAALLGLPDSDVDRLVQAAPPPAPVKRRDAKAVQPAKAARPPRRRRVGMAAILAALVIAGFVFFLANIPSAGDAGRSGGTGR